MRSPGWGRGGGGGGGETETENLCYHKMHGMLVTKTCRNYQHISLGLYEHFYDKLLPKATTAPIFDPLINIGIEE
jgi:hypothetical protein